MAKRSEKAQNDCHGVMFCQLWFSKCKIAGSPMRRPLTVRLSLKITEK